MTVQFLPSVRLRRAGRDDAGLLGLFPALTVQAGGIQRSGMTAWHALRSSVRRGRPILFQYGPAAERLADDGLVVSASSRTGALFAALRRQWPVGTVLVWHLSLLKLVPFLRVPRARVIQVLHGIEAWRPPGALTRALLRRVDVFLSDTDYTWSRFLSVNAGLRSAARRTVHLGLGSPVAGPVAAPADTPAVLMIGRLARSEDYKGHREMIAAWPRVVDRHSGAELWVVGEGDLRPDLEEMVRIRGLQDRVRFWGWVSEDEKQELLARSRCLALPSRGEGFGLVYLEAMRMGRPCLVSTLDAGREIVNPPEAGLAADPGRVEEITDAVCRLLAPGPDWERWSAQARCRYDGHFTAEHYQRRLVAALEAAQHADGDGD